MKNMKLTLAEQVTILECRLSKEVERQATLYKRYNKNMNRLNLRIKQGFQSTEEGSELQRILSLSVKLQGQIELSERDMKEFQKQIQELQRVAD